MNTFPFRDTAAWDEEAGLPYFPKTNNGHLYFAFTLRLERPEVTDDVRHNLRTVAVRTEFGFKRWNSYIPVSHDEIRGYCFAAWYSNELWLTEALDAELSVHGGNLKENVNEGMKRNFFRLMDMEACLKAARKMTPTPMEQVAFFFAKVFQALTVKSGEASGILRTWLYVPVMREYPLCNLALMIWDLILVKRGFTLEEALRLELQVPEIAERANGRTFLQ
jgi:hypothetical protein